MAPPKKTAQQKPSPNPHRGNEGNNSAPNDQADIDFNMPSRFFSASTNTSGQKQYYRAETKYVQNPANNRIGERSIQDQLRNSPGPRDTGKSGYPHKFTNKYGAIPQLVRSQSNSSSTTSLFEYPIFADGRTYNYQSKKPKDDPGHIRGITNQNKRFKGVIAHDGEDGNPKRGSMHWVMKE
ncbi:hypothetical protein N8I77_009439 [Diaporthe amygdali]|uniref:Uncharacterized protein n=1 Tax=Phomopsis amygdali TaxID=1214568 RepID=A0AAD9W0H8_PHOAM|nr:hypothetical protein N8I77_009439 [Diaporthe amygdali]